ncbi:MAG: hypothetical protein WAT21_08205 [Saprospiraceae bacterium]
MTKILAILFIFNIISTSIISQSIACVGNQIGTINYNQLNSINNTLNTINLPSNITTNFSALNDQSCGARIHDAKMLLKFDVGEDYEFGSLPWNISFEIVVSIYSGGNLFFTNTTTIVLNQNQPELLYVIDYPNLCFLVFSTDIKFKVNNLNSTATTGIQNAFRCIASYEYSLKTLVEDVTITVNDVGNSTVSSNPVQFTWNPSCACNPNYEIQILRLYNALPYPQAPPNPNESIVTAFIDWSKALTIETQSKEPNITLTLAEGTGYYIWRVRAIGDYFTGGYGNSQNWGEWSPTTTSNTISFSGSESLPYVFFYDQFDKEKNWIYSRHFSEAEPGGYSKVKISEEMTFANGLQQVRQHQKHLFSQGNVVANHTGIDFSGRPALATIYAPVLNQNHLGYKNNFIKNGSNSYSAVHFDSDTKFKSHDPITHGDIIDYYDNGSDMTIPSSEGYPFTRTLYYGDGMGRVKEISGIGAPLKMDTLVSHQSHTTKYYYSGVSHQELIRIFGDEAPAASSVIKMLTVDPNHTASVTYQTKEGQTIATCLSESNNTDHHLPLDTRDSFIVKDIIEGDISCGNGCISSSTTVCFAMPTALTVNYEIEAGQLAPYCNLNCTTCDYVIEIFIRRIDDPYAFTPLVHTVTLPPDLCTSSTGFSWSQTINLEPGTYLVERRVKVYNLDPTSTVFNTYLDNQLQTLEDDIQATVNADPVFNTINTYLQTADLTGLYNYLVTSQGMATDATSFTFQTSCCSFTIPIIQCETCPIQDNDFEEYFNTLHPDHPVMNYLPGFTSGQFNTLITNMLDPAQGNYSAQPLCDCWTATVQSWPAIADISPDPDEPYNPPSLLHTFLKCAGYKFKPNPFSTTPFSAIPHNTTNGYLSHAYAYFNYDPSNPSDCEQSYCNFYPPPSPATTVCNITIPATINWGATNWSNETWLEFMECTQNIGVISVPDAGTDILQTISELNEACNQSCETKFLAYQNALMHYYENILIKEIGNCANCISMEQIKCQAQILVDNCKTKCSGLSPTYSDVDGDGLADDVSGIDPDGLDSYYEAMYYAFEIVNANVNNLCPQNYEFVSGNNATIIEIRNDIVDMLNFAFAQAIDNGLTTFNTYDSINNFINNPAIFNSLSCLHSISTSIALPQNGYFIIKDCRLYFNFIDSQADILICNDLCDEKQDSCNVCIRYFPPTPIVPDHTFEAITCAQQTSDYLTSLLQSQLLYCIDSLKAEYHNLYLNSCIDPALINDEFSLSYKLGYYHYTLYYYDRAGNLVQTVPPSGVDETSTSRMMNPPHGMKTQYRYNTLKQLIWQFTPDGNETEFIYDRKGQLRFSQNAQQKDDGTYAFTRYDHLGRITEVGKATLGSLLWLALKDPVIADDMSFPDEATYTLSERVFTIYSKSYPNAISGGRKQRYLQNRVSYTYTDDDGNLATKDDQRTNIYSYDPHGNVEWMINDVMPEIAASGPTIRQITIDYSYDLISNKVLQLSYMKGRADQFFTKYSYDEDNRITTVYTSRDQRIWDRDSRYEYYQHGPLRRHLLGEDKIQGIDHVYTIQGWLKSINHPSLDQLRDPGLDGVPGSKLPKDVFASGLTYFTGDFVKTGSNFIPGQFFSGTNPIIKNLYNGNIAQWVSNSEVPSAALPNFKYPRLTSRSFVYDELNRIKISDFSPNKSGTWHQTKEYDSDYSYDANGNIESLHRHAYKLNPSPISSLMDKLAYTYDTGPARNNQLRSVKDHQTVTTFDGDLEGLSNYTYDKIGNTISDVNNGIQNISWNLMGKVKKITKTDGTNIDFAYDAMGNRVLKKVSPVGTTPEFTWYAPDPSGNQVSTYHKIILSGAVYSIQQDEAMIYGSDRTGIWNTNVNAIKYNSTLGYTIQNIIPSAKYQRTVHQKLYELNDHLGNVRMNVTDVKESNSGVFDANFKGVYDYYPFGSQMVGRVFDGEYRYGYGGHEKDNEIKGSGNHISFINYGYDPRIGRRWRFDPLASKHPDWTPYNYCANNPILLVDPDGRDWVISQSIKDDGTTVIQIMVTGKLINQSSTAYTSDQMSAYSTRLGDAIKSYYGGASEDKFEVNVTTNISVASNDNQLSSTDHAFSIVDDGKLPDSQNPGGFRPAGVIGHASFGMLGVYINENVLSGTPVGIPYIEAGTGRGADGSPTLERTGSHELGHTGTLTHEAPNGNLMLQTGNPNAGTKITKDQIIQMKNAYDKGDLNKGIQFYDTNVGPRKPDGTF